MNAVSEAVSVGGVALVSILTCVADGCILLAVTVAASSSVPPRYWALSFGGAHGILALLGAAAAGALSHEWHVVSHVLAAACAIILLRHLLKHALHDCAAGGCAHTRGTFLSSIPAVLGTSFALSLDALTRGPIFLSLLSRHSFPTIAALCVVDGLLVGSLIWVLVSAGGRAAQPFTRFRSYGPKFATGVVYCLACYLVHLMLVEVAHETGSGVWPRAAVVAYAAGAVWLARKVSGASAGAVDPAPVVVSIGRRGR